MQFDEDDNEIKTLLRENQRLLVENNQLLRQMRRGTIIATVFRLIWFVVIICIPLYIYFYYIAPNWENLQQKLENIEDVSAKMEGVKPWFESLNSNPKP
jgi:Trk-type K+ transport system membrane component